MVSLGTRTVSATVPAAVGIILGSGFPKIIDLACRIVFLVYLVPLHLFPRYLEEGEFSQ